MSTQRSLTLYAASLAILTTLAATPTRAAEGLQPTTEAIFERLEPQRGQHTGTRGTNRKSRGAVKDLALLLVIFAASDKNSLLRTGETRDNAPFRFTPPGDRDFWAGGRHHRHPDALDVSVRLSPLKSAPIPEPAFYQMGALLVLGGLGLLARARRRSRFV